VSVSCYKGDLLDVLPTLAANSVDAVVTDPPYGLRFMGRRWDYDVPSVDMWREVLRVLKPGGHLLSFGGSRTYHRVVVNIEDAGFEIRDCIMWLYGSGFPKSLNIGGGWGTALKPAHELIVLARKPLAGTVAANVQEWGTGALNIDGCRIESGADYHDLEVTQGGNHRHDVGLKEKTRHEKFVPSPGRWPANVIHDGSEEVLEAFPDAAGQLADASSSSSSRKTQNVYGAMKRGNGRDGEASAERRYAASGGTTFAALPGARRGDTGSAARFFYCAKASKSDRSENGEVENKHPTVKPTDLMRYLCRLVTPPGGIVLDPFMGSGSTGKAAVLEGFQFIGIDRDPEYVQLATRRIALALEQRSAETSQGALAI
jgi:site-specific DNA-methyltransferase (adenine-specific)